MWRLGVSLLVAILSAPITARSAGPPLTLTVQPSSANYAPGERPGLQLTLTLSPSASASATVCAFPHGTVRVLRVMRDGVRVRPERSIVYFDANPESSETASLVTLRPGQTVAIPYDVSGALGAVGTYALRDIRLSKRPGRAHKVFVYPLSSPGTFTVQLAYKYAGPDGGLPNVARSPVVSNLATFHLQ
jgi:hypothetical protein